MMPAIALIGVPGPRWLPPFPLPLFLLWPLVPVLLGIAALMKRSRPDDAKRLWLATRIFCELRGLSIHTRTGDHRSVRIRLV